MASKLLTTETSSEGNDEGPETRAKVIANIKSALQNYLGSNTTITVITVPGQGPTKDCDHGVMTAANTTNIVTPDVRRSSLAYYNTAQFSFELFLCNTNDSTDTRFMYLWQEAGKSYIGAPYLTEVTNFGHPVPVSKNEITRQVAENTVAAIESSFENMMPDVPFRDVRFVWNRCSRQGDFNFIV